MFEAHDLFMGETPKFWLELKAKAEVLDVTDYIAEIAELRGIISFYEKRIQQMHDLMETHNG